MKYNNLCVDILDIFRNTSASSGVLVIPDYVCVCICFIKILRVSNPQFHYKNTVKKNVSVIRSKLATS